uniref:Uncharacterized protein n=1 Tax=Sphaerodactylus townsendi TaxID=933632 RepID=A0ACB8G6A0_9SAUR
MRLRWLASSQWHILSPRDTSQDEVKKGGGTAPTWSRMEPTVPLITPTMHGSPLPLSGTESPGRTPPAGPSPNLYSTHMVTAQLHGLQRPLDGALNEGSTSALSYAPVKCFVRETTFLPGSASQNLDTRTISSQTWDHLPLGKHPGPQFQAANRHANPQVN